MLALALAALSMTLGLVACGGGDESASTTVAGGAEGGGEGTVEGSFEPVAGVPAPYGGLSGEAELSRAGGRTTTTISLEGLVADTKYVAHLHTGGCGGEDPGGPHFKFDPSAGDQPPNEIHLSFTTDNKGSGSAKATSNREVPAGEAGSIVVHTDGDAMTAAAGERRFASLFVHEGSEDASGGEDHGSGHDDHGSDDHGSDDAPGSHGGGIQPLSAKVACAELEGGSSGGETASPGADLPTIEVKNGEPVGGIQKLEYSAGEQIRFRVSGDEAEEIHVHGYDLMEEIPAGGGTVEFDFPAEIEGIFEAELEGKGVQIAELQVNP